LGIDCELSPVLSPLEGRRSDISVLSGLDNLDKGHVQLTGSFLTGKQITGKRNGVSLDKQVAAQVGGRSPLQFVVLGTG